MASLSMQIRWMLQCFGVVCSERSTRYRDGDEDCYCVEKSKMESNSSYSCSEAYKAEDDDDDHQHRLTRNYIFIPSMHGGVMIRKLT